jgi:hypothetical protein
MIATGTTDSGSVWPPGTVAEAAGRRAFPRPVPPGRNQGVPASRRNPPPGGEGAGRGSDFHAGNREGRP